ncbi:MAG: hypothetical protein BJ554DRAFT_707, partial [Olpidium bornovanus]
MVSVTTELARRSLGENTELLRLQGAVEELDAAKRRAEEDADRCQDVSHAYRQKCEQLQGLVATLEGQMASLSAERDWVASRHQQELDEHICAHRSRIFELESALEDARRVHEARLNELTVRHHRELDARAEDRSRQPAGPAETLAATLRELESARRLTQNPEGATSLELRRRGSDLERSLAASRQELEHTKQEYEADIRRLSEKVSNSRETGQSRPEGPENLESLWAAAQKEADELRGELHRIPELQRALEQSQRDLVACREEFHREAVNANNELRRISDLERGLAQSQKESEELKQQLSRSRAAEKSFEETLLRISELEGLLRQREEEKNSSRELEEDERRKRSAYEAALDDARKQLSEQKNKTRGEIESLQSKMSELETALDRSNIKQNELSLERDRLRRSREDLQTDLRRAGEELAE